MENRPIIYIPTRPQPDTIVAIFLLQTFARERMPGIDHAHIEVRATVDPHETFESLLEKNIVALDLGGFVLDHHNKGQCTSHLVAQYLGIEKDPSIGRLLGYAKRDDEEGKGIISTDPIDRAFGLSGLIASLNKTYPHDAQKVVDTVTPLLTAHLTAAREHHIELPKEVIEKKQAGKYEEVSIQQKKKQLKMVCIVSDKPSMPTYLRSSQGPQADVVLQKAESSNNFCIVTRQERNIDLSKVAALIRMREGDLNNTSIPEIEEYLTTPGRIEEVGHWYYDQATNSLLNGGPHNPDVPESAIQWDEMKKIVKSGIEVGGK